MRAALLAVGLLTLTSCLSPEQQAQIDAQNNAAEDSYCRSISAVPGTDAYIQCRMFRSQQRANDEMAQQARRQAAAAAFNNAINPQPKVSCTSRSNIYGGQDTSCY